MNEHVDTDEAGAAARGMREALLVRAGGLAFAVYADECECVTEWSEPAPLPHAPAAVLGVVSVRGRMRTVLDPARLFDAPGSSTGPDRRPEAYTHLVSLAGDEQLALASAAPARVPLAPRDLHPEPDPPSLPARGTFPYGGETAHLLDPARLFDAAMRGTERRRRRS